MPIFNRRYFLNKVVLAGIATVISPKFLRAATSAAFASVPRRYDPSYFGIVDLHCHPSMKMYLWGRKLWRKHTAGLGVNGFDMQDDMEELTTGIVPHEPDLVPGEQRNGLVRGIVVAHYLPEEGIEQWDSLKKIYPWIARLFKKLADKIEHGDWTNIDQTLRIIDEMEEQARKAYCKRGRVQFVVATSFRHFQDAIDQGKFPIAHAIEGAHALGRDKSVAVNKGRKRLPDQNKMKLTGDTDSSQYIRNLTTLRNRGVCMMTLAHLFPNDIVSCVEGISPDEKESIKMKSWVYADTPEYNKPLTPVGVDVVNWMLDKGMIVDLTHSTPKARTQVFEINGKYGRPLVFTHTGAEAVFVAHDRDKYANFRFYCVTDDEIAAICACHGTIGVIPEVFWLAGGDTHLRCKGLPPKSFRNGIPYMVETIKYINSRTPDQDYNHISIGTDFDGYADAPQDLYEASQLDALIEALRAEHISDANVRKIMSGNALRVLEQGWG